MPFLPTLETARLVLREVTLADVDAIFAACSQPAVTRFTLFDTHAGREVSDAFVRTYAVPNYVSGTPDPFALALKDAPDRLIGCAGLAYSEQPHVRELGYWLHPSYWGRGLATEAARELVRYAFEHLKAVRVQSRVIVGNDASARVLAKAGFQHEGTMRSALMRRGRIEDVMLFAAVRAAGPPAAPGSLPAACG